MLWTEELFHVKKPIIAMLHLEPLPGDPLFSRGTDMQQIADLAKRDLEALQRGGVDGVLISNEFSLPYQRKVDTVTTAAMAFVLGQLRSEISVPYGVDCISDGDATIELAAAVDADFVRGTFCGYTSVTAAFTTTIFPPLCAARPHWVWRICGCSIS